MILAPDSLQEDIQEKFSLLIEKMDDLIQLEYFSKGSVLIDSKEETHSKFYIIKSGISRSYCLDSKGTEFTRLLFMPGMAISGLRYVIGYEDEDVKYQCLTDCEMYVGDFNVFINLTKTNLDYSVLYNQILELMYLLAERRVNEMSFSAKKKYIRLQKRVPNIDNVLPQYQIAYYLNITNVQLSRIRKQMLFE